MNFFKSAVYVGILGIAAHFVGEAMDRDKIDETALPYRAFEWERGGRIYRKIGVRQWKDKLPDMSRVLPDMVPKRLPDASDTENVRRLIKETCVAEMVHIWLSILFFFGIWIIDRFSAEGFLWGLFAVLCNTPYIIVQRYNRPMLLRHLALLEKKQGKEQEDDESALLEEG